MVCFNAVGEKSKGSFVVHRELLAKLGFANSTHFTVEAVSLSCQQPLLLPRIMCTAPLGERSILKIPMPFWLPIVESLKSFANFSLCFFAALLAFPMRKTSLAHQFCPAFARTSFALVRMACLHKVGRTAVGAGAFNLRRSAIPGTKAGFASCLNDTKSFAATFAGFFDLLKSAFVETFSATKLLTRLCRWDIECFGTLGAFSDSHSISIS